MLPQAPARLVLRLGRVPFLALSLTLASFVAPLAYSQQTINVDNGDVVGFITAIQTLNASGGGTIDLASGGTYSATAPSDWWYGPNAFPAIASAITINGNGATVSRASGSPKFRFFYVSGGFSNLPAGSLTLNNLTLSNGLAQGGAGGGGAPTGGGGAGLGGAVYNQGSLNLSQVSFTSNAANGGAGGPYAGSGAGGGGGLGGDGGLGPPVYVGQYYGGNGGGGGFKGNGGAGGSNSYVGGGGGSFLANEGGGRCSGAGYSDYGGNGGNSSGSNFPAGGGGGGFTIGENGGGPHQSGANDYGGNGATGGGNGGQIGGATNSMCGGGGGAFGGGGSGGDDNIGGAGGGGVGGGGGGGFDINGSGGNGGFGGGGGADSGSGGFGGGGGGKYTSANCCGGGSAFGGAGGASGFPSAPGGGGAGFGGAVFNHLGTATITNSTFTSNSATGGGGANTSDGFGGAIFNLNGTVELTDDTFTGNTAKKSNATTDLGAAVYNLSHNAGNVVSGQTPLASLILNGTTLSATNGDLQNNQADGTAVVTTTSGNTQPFAVIAPAVLSFESLWQGYVPAVQTVTLTNLGPATLSITSIALGSGTGFTIASNNCPSSLVAAASCQVGIAFAGTAAAGNTLIFTTNSAVGATQAVSLVGNFPSQPGPSQLAFFNGPPATTFVGQAGIVNVLEKTSGGTQRYGSTDTITLTLAGPNSYSQTYTATAVHGMASFNLPGAPPITGSYTNTASAPNLSSATATTTVVAPVVGASAGMTTVSVNIANSGVLNSIQVLTQGVAGLDFTETGGGTCTVGAHYSAGQSCTVNVDLTPLSAGLRSGAVLLTSASGPVLGTGYISANAQGPQITCSAGSTSGIGGGWNGPTSVAVDGEKNLYVVDNNRLSKVPFADGSYESPIVLVNAGYPNTPNSVAVDAAENVFYTNFNTVVELPFNGTSYESPLNISDQLSPGWSDPTGIAVDGEGNLFVIDYDNSQVIEVPWTGTGYGAGITVVSGVANLPFPLGIAVDGADNVYVADGTINAVLQFPFTGSGFGGANYLGSGFTQVSGVAVDATGNVYAIDPAGQTISRIPWTGSNWGGQTTVLGINGSAGISFDSLGNIYIGTGSSTVEKLTVTNPPSFNFPTSTNIGSVDTADGPQTVSLFNIGNQPLLFTTPTTGSNPSYPAGFPANTSDGSLCSSTAPLAQGSTCDVSVNFQPTVAGTNAGTVVLTDNALNVANATQSISLSGTGIVNQPATLTSPTPGLTTKLGTTNVTFQWTTAPGATLYQLNLGTTAGASNLFLYKGAAASATALTLPANNVTVYATLYSKINGVWLSNAYVYTESGTPTPAALTSPTPGLTTKLGTANVAFHWTAGISVTNYQLNLSAVAAGGKDLFTYKGTALTATAPTLPANGVKVYARLYSYLSGVWQYNDYVYTETGTPTPAALTSPTPGLGTTLGTSNVTFQWTSGIDVTNYQLNLSATTPGAKELFSYKGTALTTTAPTLPGNGTKVYARLYSYVNGAWQYNDYVYTEGGTPTPATLTSPTPGLSTILGTTSVTFQWTAGIAVSVYQLNLSAIAPGGHDLYSYKGTALTTTAPTLPANGVKVYARLYSYINGTWQYNDYQYTEQ